ncbi:MAG: toll/interleukin-1 receptor domain-containing protein [Phycisphaerae bacterium]|nr:toll/interleukin-1 receptor domain-containing protein [Phycisphaerae bacterium]
MTASSGTDPVVFIGYSHKDESWATALVDHLSRCIDRRSIATWSDREGKSRSQWLDMMEETLGSAEVVVLLVTPDFLSSGFIREGEFVPALKKAEYLGGVRILWIPVLPSAYERSPLAIYRPILHPTTPLAMMESERETTWEMICWEIAEAARTARGPRYEAEAPAEADDSGLRGDGGGERAPQEAEVRNKSFRRIRGEAASEPTYREAAAEPIPKPEASPPPLHWNTRFPQQPEVHATRELVAGKTYRLETVIEPRTGPEDLDSASVDIQKLLGPGEETVDVVFCVEGEGLEVRLAGAAESDFAALVESEPLPCSVYKGCSPFLVDVRGTLAGQAALTLSLLARNAVVCRRRLEFHVVMPAASPVPMGLGPAAGSSSPLVTARSVNLLATNWAEIRITIDSSKDAGKKCSIALGKNGRTGNLVDLPIEKSQIDALGSELRIRLDKLSNQYDPDPSASGEEFGLRLCSPESVMLEFAKIGAELAEKLFGSVANPSSLDLREIAKKVARTSGGEGSRLQIDAEYLPVPWALLYDSCAYACEIGSGHPDYARYKPRFKHLTQEGIDYRRFWGYRFAIDRITRGESPDWVEGQKQIQVFINPDIAGSGVASPAANQEAFFEELTRTRGLPVDTRRTNDELEAFLADGEMRPTDLLYFYCHARRASSTSLRGTVLRGEEASKSACVLLAVPPERLTVEEMWMKRDEPLSGSPLVFLNACGSGSGDPEFQSPFLDLFTNKYRVRGYVGTDWEVPSVFADAFARRVLQRYVVEGIPLGLAFHQATREALEVYNNPFGLIYCLYASPGLCFSQGG